MKTHEYAFDIKLVAAIRVKAPCAIDGVDELRRLLCSTTANLGAFANGDPIVCEVSLDHDTWPHLYEIDGEPV